MTRATSLLILTLTTGLLLLGGCGDAPGPGTSSATSAATASSEAPTSSPPPTSTPSVAAAEVPTLLERAIVAQFESGAVAPRSDFAAPFPGAYLCAAKVFGRDGARVYARVACSVYRTGRDAEELSGSSLLYALDVRGSGAGAVVEHAETPEQATIAADTRRLFPPDVLDAMYDDQSDGTDDLRPPDDARLEAARHLP